MSDWLTLPDRLLTEAHVCEHTTVGDLDRRLDHSLDVVHLRALPLYPGSS